MWVCPAHLTEAFFKKKPLLFRVFWPWTALGTARISSWRRRQKTGREMSSVSSLKQPEVPKMKGSPHWPMRKEGKSTWSLTEVKALDYCQELCITCWLTLCLLTACPWTLAPGFLPNSETTAPKQLHQPLQHSPLLQKQAVQERAGRRTSPCFWAKKGVSRKHLSEAGVRRWGRIKSQTMKAYADWLWSKHHAWCSQCGCVLECLTALNLEVF